MSEHSPERLDYAEDIVDDVKFKDGKTIEVSSGEDSGKVSDSESHSEGETGSDTNQDSDGETDGSGSSIDKNEPKQPDNPWVRGLMLAKEKLLKNKQLRQEQIQKTSEKSLKLRAPVKQKDSLLLPTEEFYLEFNSLSSNNPIYSDYYQQSFIGHTPLTWRRILPSDVREPSTKKINEWRKKTKKNSDVRKNRYSSESSNSNSDSDSSNSDNNKESDAENEASKNQNCPSPVSSYSSGLSSLVDSYLEFPLSPKRNITRKNRSRSNSRKRRSSSSRSASSNDSSASSNHSKRNQQQTNINPHQRKGERANDQHRDYNSWRQNQNDNRRNFHQNRYQNNNSQGFRGRGRNENRFNRYNYNSRYNNNDRRDDNNRYNNNNNRYNARNEVSDRRRAPNRPIPPTYNSSHSSRSSSSRSSSNRRHRKPTHLRDRSLIRTSPINRDHQGNASNRAYKRSSSRSSSSGPSSPRIKSDPHHLAPLLAGAVNPTKDSGPPAKISLNETSESYSGSKRRFGRSRSSSSSMSEPENRRRLQNTTSLKTKRSKKTSANSGSESEPFVDNLSGNINRERSPFDVKDQNLSSNPGPNGSNQDRLRELRERLTMVNDAIANITSQK